MYGSVLVGISWYVLEGSEWGYCNGQFVDVFDNVVKFDAKELGFVLPTELLGTSRLYGHQVQPHSRQRYQAASVETD